MASFNNLALTVSGVKVLLEAQSGKKLTLSKIGLGSGTTMNSTSLTKLVKPELMLPISEKKIDADSGYMTIIAKMTNEDIAEGFYWRETGLFFENSSGNDVLFAYSCVTDKYDYIPAYSDQRYVKQIRIANIITDSGNITINENEGLMYVDTITFNEFREKSSDHFETKASEKTLGHVRVTNSSEVTDSTGFALAATEKNASIEGTMAHDLQIAYEHSQVAHAPSNAQANVQSDWNATDTASDAYIANKPASLPANGGNAATVNNHTVNADVPSNAKFTDTTYSTATTSAAGLMSAADKTKLNEMQEQITGKLEANGDGSNLTETFTQASELTNIVTGENHATIFGKIAKAISDYISHKTTVASTSVLGHVKVDKSLSSTSANPVQNKAVNSALSGKLATNGNGSNTTVYFSQAAARENIVTGAKQTILMGKIQKWFADMTAAAFAQVITSYPDLMANTLSGYLVDALAVKQMANEINSNLGQTTPHMFVLPNGLKICWGNNAPSSGLVTVTFPVVYEQRAPYIIATANGVPNNETTIVCAVQSATTTEAKIRVTFNNGVSIGAASQTVYWLAIGY